MKNILLAALLSCLLSFLGHAQLPAGYAAQDDEALFGPGPVSKPLPSHIQLNLNRDAPDPGDTATFAHAMFIPDDNATDYHGFYYSIRKNGSVKNIRTYYNFYFPAAEYFQPWPTVDSYDETWSVWAYASDYVYGFHRLMYTGGNDNALNAPVSAGMRELTYDYAHKDQFNNDGRMLGLRNGCIYEVDMSWGGESAGNVTMRYDYRLHEEVGRPIAMACNLVGELYFVTLSEDGTSSQLCYFEADDEDLSNPVTVGDLGWAAMHTQSMAFNHQEGDVLYWWQCDADNNTNLVIVDTETAATTLFAGPFETEMAGLVFEFVYRPYTAFCADNELGTVRLKNGSAYTLTQNDYKPGKPVDFQVSSEESHMINNVYVVRHDNPAETVLTIPASQIVGGRGTFTMPVFDVDIVGEWIGDEHDIAYEWTPDDVDGLLNGPATGNYNAMVAFSYATDANGYILTGLTAQSGSGVLDLSTLPPDVEGQRQFKMPDGDVTVTGTFEAIGLEQLDDICQRQPATVPSYTVPEGVTGNALKVKKPGAEEWVAFADSDWTDGAVFDVAGTWQYRVELTNGYGTFMEELSFEVYYVPESITLTGNTEICEGGRIELNAVLETTDAIDGTFAWYEDNTLFPSPTTIQQLSIGNCPTTFSGSHWSVVYTTPQGCRIASDPVEITVHPKPEVTWVQPEDGDNAVLINESIELEAAPEGGAYSYVDPATGETVELTDNTFTFPGAGEFELTYRYEDEHGCANEASVNLNVVQHHFIYYQEKDSINFPENFTLDGANVYTVDEADILYGVAGDVMTLNIEVPECNHLVSMDINARDESGSVYTIYNATEPINPYTFTMPAEHFFAGPYYVTVDAGWAPNEYSITAESSYLNCPATGICGEDVTVEYGNVVDSILIDFAVESACESEIETAVTLPDQITFTMPDCAVSVFSYYEPISLSQLDDICQWRAPGVPGFATSSDYYTSYTYKVQKPGGNEWIDFAEVDWKNDFLFDVAGSWKYYVELTNGYGTFVSAEMSFAVVAAPEIVGISGYNEYCEHNNLLLNVEYQPDDGSTSGSIQWYKDGDPLNSETLEYLFIENCSLGDAGSYTVIYTNDYCQYMSRPYEVTVNPLPEVAWVEPEDGAMITGSIELQATPEGGTFYYLNSAGTSAEWEEITGNTFTFPEVGQYALKYYYEDENGCSNESEVRTVNVGREVHLIDGTGGTLSLSGTQTIFMPGDPVVVNGTPNDCMHITDITVYKTGDHSVMVASSFDFSSGECTFEMPDYDVDVVAGWAVNKYTITYQTSDGFEISGPQIGSCGSEMNISYTVEVGYMLTELLVISNECDSNFDVTPTGTGNGQFQMPDCNVSVSGTCQSIGLEILDYFCQWHTPGAPTLQIGSDVDYTSYEYKVKKPGSDDWITFTDDNWSYGEEFGTPGVWQCYVEFTNDFGTFPTSTVTFEVIEFPLDIAISGNTAYCEGETITLTVVPTPDNIDLSIGIVSWYTDNSDFFDITGPELTITNCSTDHAGNYSVMYHDGGGLCDLVSGTFVVTVSEVPEVYFVEPANDTTVLLSSESLSLSAYPEGGTYSYEDPVTGDIVEFTENTFTFPQAGSFELTYSYTNDGGCTDEASITVNVSGEVHLIDGTGGTLSLSSTQTVFMPGDPVSVTSEANDCMTLASITVYKTGDHSVTVTSSFEETSGECTFEMPEYDVDVVAQWASKYIITCRSTFPDAVDFSITGSGQCGSEMTISYDNVEGYILNSITVKAGDTDVPVILGTDNTATFIMPDSDVTVTGFYQAIELEDLFDVCQWSTPGVPEFNLSGVVNTTEAWPIDFESGFPEGWTTIDADNDGWTWTMTSVIQSTWSHYSPLSFICHHSGSNAICSCSFINGVGPLSPDNYFVSPQVIPSKGTTFSFWAVAMDPYDYADHFGVAVSTTTPDPSEFTMLQEWTMTTKYGEGAKMNTWYNYSVDLSDYAGQSIYIAIRHFNCYNQYILGVDDISLDNNHSGKNDDLSYEYQVYLDHWMTLDDWTDDTAFDEVGEWSYRVALTNAYGTFYSVTKTFEVYEAPKSIAIECPNSVANLGTSTTLSVVPTPSTFTSFNGFFQWFKDGTEVINTLEPVLTINDCELSDEGDYTVTYRHFNPDIPVEGLTYDFEDRTLQGWTNIDADGDYYHWSMYSGIGSHNGSNNGVLSYSKYFYDNTILYPDNYLVSPQIVLGGSISFYACARDASRPAEHFGVAVSTSGNTSASDFTTIQEWTMTAKSVGTPADPTHSGNRDQGNWYQYTVDLSDYYGHTGYVAIRHFDCFDQSALIVDDIHISTPFAGVDLCEFTSDPFEVEVIEEESSYPITYHPDNNFPENGFVSGPTASTAGADVTVTLSPAADYNCTALKYTYTDIAGLQEFNINPVNNEAHFTMVPYAVDVWAEFTPIDWTFTLYYMLEGTTTQVATPYTGIFHYNDAINVPSPNVTGLVPLTDPYVGVMPNNHFVDTVYYTGDIFEVVFCEDLQAMSYVLNYSTDHTNNMVQALTNVTVNVELEAGWSCNMTIKNLNTGEEIYTGDDNSVTFNMPLSDVMVCLEATETYWDDFGIADIDWFIGHENDDEFVLTTDSMLGGLAALVTGRPWLWNEGFYTEEQINALWGENGVFYGKTFIVDSDQDDKLIDLIEHKWRPIGAQIEFDRQFAGYFDGNGNKIINMRTADTCFLNVDGYGDCQAFFGNIGYNGVVNDLDIQGVAQGRYFTAGIAGVNFGTIINSVANVTVGSKFEAGGIVANNYGYIINSYCAADAIECWSAAPDKVAHNCYVGGVAAWNHGDGIIDNCHSVAFLKKGSGNELGNYYGFLVGNNEGMLNNSYWMTHTGNGATTMVGKGTTGTGCTEMDGTTAIIMDANVDLISTYGFDFLGWKAGEDDYPVFDRESKGFMDINNTELNISLYPNPTSGDAKIVSDHSVIRRVTVYNLMGQTILDEVVNNTETTLRIKDVATGMYMVKVSTENGYVMKRLVVE